jgi:hypothetical protein
MTQLYYTIDTEYEPGFTARKGVDSRRENFERSILGRTAEGDAGIVYQLDAFDRHGLKAVFFVDPMPALLWGVGAIADMVEPIVSRGHDVQLHLHTEWLALAGAANPLGDRTGQNLRDFTFEDQCALLCWAKDTLVAAGAPRPIAFRAGNYGANDHTLRALAELGFTHETSHSPGFAASPCDISLGTEDRRPLRHCGITEVPIGCVEDVGSGLRHAQLTALSLAELTAALEHARDHDMDDFTLVSHSFELLCRSRKRINRIVRRRFDLLCEAVAAMEGVSTATYSEAPPEPRRRPYPRPALPRSPVRAGARMVEQAVANTFYGDRPLFPGWKAGAFFHAPLSADAASFAALL